MDKRVVLFWFIMAMMFAVGTAAAVTRFNSLSDSGAFYVFVACMGVMVIAAFAEAFVLDVRFQGSAIGDVVLNRSFGILLVGVLLYTACMFAFSHGLLDMVSAEQEINDCEKSSGSPACKEVMSKCKEFKGDRIKRIRGIIAAFTVIAGLVMAYGIYQTRKNYLGVKETVSSLSGNLTSSVATLRI